MCLELYPECGDGGDGCCERRLEIALGKTKIKEMIDGLSDDRRGGNMLGELSNNRTEYSIRWVNVDRSEVHAFRYVDGERVTVGCCFRGSERACRLYVGQKIGGFELIGGRLVDKPPQVIPQPAPKLTAVRKLLTGS